MMLKLSPVQFHQACAVRSSRIPHLLTALALKRGQIQLPIQSRRQQSTPSHFLPSNLPQRLRPAPHSPNRPAPAATATTRDKRAIYFASLFGFAIALYLSFLYAGVRRDWARSGQLLLQLGPDADVSDRWDALGRNYDDEIEFAEKAMFMGRKRKRLVAQAKGEVLEVSVGTGRNMGYYDMDPGAKPGESEHAEGRVTGLVFNDKAGVMVEAARKKFDTLEARKIPAQRFKGSVGFVTGDAGAEGVIEKPGAGFDTIVQTMGLCSTKDPVGLLKRIGELCKKPTGAGKADGKGGGAQEVNCEVVEGKYGKGTVAKTDDEYDGGRVLLLEHGRGYYHWLNDLLDGLAPAHADHYGCWWNRDIGAIVEQSGLEVEYITRYHLGTTWEVVLRPKREQEVVGVAASGGQESKRKSTSKSTRDGVFGWMSTATSLAAEALSWR